MCVKRKYSFRSSYEEYKIECHKFEALKQQRLNGIAHSRSLYQLIAKLAKNDKDGIFATEDLLRMLMGAVRPRTNICVISDILAAIYHIFCKRSRVDTHALFQRRHFQQIAPILVHGAWSNANGFTRHHCIRLLQRCY